MLKFKSQTPQIYPLSTKFSYKNKTHLWVQTVVFSSNLCFAIGILKRFFSYKFRLCNKTQILETILMDKASV
jgi:hypothetical protein